MNQAQKGELEVFEKAVIWLRCKEREHLNKKKVEVSKSPRNLSMHSLWCGKTPLKVEMVNVGLFHFFRQFLWLAKKMVLLLFCLQASSNLVEFLSFKQCNKRFLSTSLSRLLHSENSHRFPLRKRRLLVGKKMVVFSDRPDPPLNASLSYPAVEGGRPKTATLFFIFLTISPSFSSKSSLFALLSSLISLQHFYSFSLFSLSISLADAINALHSNQRFHYFPRHLEEKSSFLSL